MNITVNVDDLSLDTIVGGFYGEDGEQPLYVRDALLQAITERLVKDDHWQATRTRVREIRDEEIRTAIVPLVQQALDEPLQHTNEYGRPIGEPTTFREEVLKIARDLLATVSQSGQRGGYGSESVVHKTVREHIDRVLTKELADAIGAERAKVVAAVRAKAADLIAKAVSEGVGGR